MVTSKRLLSISLGGLLMLALFSCDTPPEPLRPTVKDPEMARQVAGVYAGEVPCASCFGIDYRVNLKPDFTYEARMIYKGAPEGEDTLQLTGAYGFTEDSILVLEKEEPGMNYFKTGPGRLTMLDLEGEEVTGDLADRYVLTRLSRGPGMSAAVQETAGPNNSLMRKLHERGIDFYARGNEPGWALDLDFEEMFSFTTMEGMSINTPPVEGAVAMDADPSRTRYYSKVEAGTLTFTLIGEECTDNMSGESFSHRVTVEVQSGTNAESATFEGCGRYVTDYDLAGSWTLATMGGKAIDTENLQKGAPQLNFDPEALRVSGHSSCNSINGGFRMEKNAIRFGRLASTMMACPEMELETVFYKTLSGRTLEYELTDDRLIFTHPDGRELVFSKD